MPRPEKAQTRTSRPPVLLWTGWVGMLLVLIAFAGSIGGPQGPGLALIVVLETLLRSGWPAAAYLLASWGMGSLVSRALQSRFAPGLTSPIRFALGLAVMLTAAHVLGSLGLLNTWTAIGLCVVGLTGLVGQLLTSQGRKPLEHQTPAFQPPPGWIWLGLPAIALLLTAAASPPGALWSSEYGAYDVLSYHLELPKEWLALGSTLPVDHNAYSFLPGSLEIAFTQLALLTGARDGHAMLASNGWRLMSAQYLHTGLAIASAWIVARLARRLAAAAGFDGRAARIASAVAGGLVLCTPWTIVVGSMSYNDLGVIVLGGGATLAACRRSDRVARQAAVVGFLVGVACCVKPTALLFVGAPAGILLLRFLPWRTWGKAVVIGSVAGLLALSPWFVRNAAMTGNPVFPLSMGVLGRDGWTPEQAERWSHAHEHGGSLTDRLRLLTWADPESNEGNNPVARWRGAANPQWLLAFPAGLLASGLLLDRRRRRLIAVGLLMGLAAQIVAWLAFTHLQSRFLIPCLLTLAPMLGLGVARLRAPRGIGLGLGALVCLVQVGGAWVIFAHERGGSPNALLVGGPGLFMGDPYDGEVGSVSPVAFVNHELPENATVLLVGGATPLYIDRPVIYATVWSRPPVLDLFPDLVIDQAPKQGDAAPAPIDASYVLIDYAELARQRGSGYLDPALTPDSLQRLVARLGPVRSWPEIGQALYRVPGKGRP